MKTPNITKAAINSLTTQTTRTRAGIKNTIKKVATRSLHTTSNSNRISLHMGVTMAGINLVKGIKGKDSVREGSKEVP